MATTTVTTNQSPGGGQSRSQTKQVIPTGETGDPVYIYNSRHCSVTVIPSGSALLQYTTSRMDEVTNNQATWITWSRGTVTGNVTDIPEGPVTAIRGVSITGQVVIEVLQ